MTSGRQEQTEQGGQGIHSLQPDGQNAVGQGTRGPGTQQSKTFYKTSADYDQLIKICTQKIQENPEHLRALLIRASSFLKIANRACGNGPVADQSSNQLCRAIAEYGRGRAPISVRGSTAPSIYAGQLQQGLSDYNKALSIDASNVDALYYRGTIYEKQGKLDDAIADFTAALQLCPDHVKATYARAACQNRKGEFARAIDDYNQALKMDQGKAQYRRLHRAQSLPRARGKGSSKGSAGSPTLQRSSSVTNHRQGDQGSPSSQGGFALSTQQFIEDLQGDNGQPQPSLRPVFMLESPTVTGAAASSIVSGGPLYSGEGCPQVTLNEGGAPMWQHSGGDSPTCGPAGLDDGEGVVPDAGKWAGKVAGSYLEAQHGQNTPGGWGAAQQQERLQRIQAADYHHAKGYAYRKQADYKMAVAEYTRALELNPHHLKALFNRGFSYDKVRFESQLGLYQQALKDYTAVLGAEPGNSYAYYNRGITRDRIADYAPAVADFTQAIQLDPSNADFYHNRGFSLRKQGEFEAAVRDYTRALELNPRHCRAFYNRAFSYDRLQRYEEAVADYSSALALEAGNATAHHNRATLLKRLGRVEEALEDFGVAIRLQPGASLSHHARGLLLERLGRHREAVADFDAALRSCPEGPTTAGVRRSRGLCLRAMGHVRRAL